MLIWYCIIEINFFVGFVATNLTIDVRIPNETALVPVMSVFGWIMIQQRHGYTFDWNLPWADYKAGFGSTDADYWFGLEKIHLLTSSQPYRLRVEVQHRSTNLWYSAEYWSFKLGDELNDKYRLEVAGYSGDAGNSLQWEGDRNGNGNFFVYHQNFEYFSTYDRDNDQKRRGKCASMHQGGWWFNQCFTACLTCKKSSFAWYTIGRVVNSRMMIKPQ